MLTSANDTAEIGGLQEQRKAVGVSQQRLADLAGCSVSMVRLLESGYRPETSDVLERIARALTAVSEVDAAQNVTSLAHVPGSSNIRPAESAGNEP